MIGETLPIKLDFFGFFMFLGIIQGLFLAFFFLSRKQKPVLANRLLGWALLSISLMVLEIFLCYTNYMFWTIHLIDFSEPLNYILGPLFYLYVRTTLNLSWRKYEFLHFLPTIFWALYSLTWHIQGAHFKYNAYIGAYYPEMEMIPSKSIAPYDFLDIREYVNHMLLLSLFTYIVLALRELYKFYLRQNLSFWSKTDKSLSFLRNILLELLGFTIIILSIKLLYEDDLGDHVLGAIITLLIYQLNYYIIRQSEFFQGDRPELSRTKYEKSSLSEEQEKQTLRKLEELLSTEKPFMDNTISLPKLAKQLQVSTHHLSQIINKQLNQSFFELIASYRVQEAQSMLSRPENHHLKIEEIAERVGYNSKSAFNTAFKKHTQMTPSAYRKQFS